MFWPEDRVDAWWQAIYRDKDGAEKPQNLICTSPSAHEMYSVYLPLNFYPWI